MGILEANLVDFFNNGDIPYHRIKLFKKDGEIIWDRKKKFSTI